MNRVVVLLLILLIGGCGFKGYLDSREYPQTESYEGSEDPGPPEVGIHSMGRIQAGGVFGGTNFLLEQGGTRYLVGAYHVLRSTAGADEILLVSSAPRLAVAGDAVRVPHQSNSSFGGKPEEAYTRGDMAALRVLEAEDVAEPLALATRQPALGEPLWIAELKGPQREPSGVALTRGVVTYSSNMVLVLKMDRATPIEWTSGAPVVNQDGEVVGVNVGYQTGPPGYFRLCVPWQSLWAALGEG